VIYQPELMVGGLSGCVLAKYLTVIGEDMPISITAWFITKVTV